jgi:hypothetical protein
MELDNKHLHEKDIMTLINGGGSCVFDMPFKASGKTLHTEGVGFVLSRLLALRNTSWGSLLG